MMRWAIIFLVVALVAAVLGFGGIANFSFEIAKFVAVVAIILFVIALVAGGLRGTRRHAPTIRARLIGNQGTRLRLRPLFHALKPA